MIKENVYGRKNHPLTGADQFYTPLFHLFRKKTLVQHATDVKDPLEKELNRCFLHGIVINHLQVKTMQIRKLVIEDDVKGITPFWNKEVC